MIAKESSARRGESGLFADGRRCAVANEKRLIDANALDAKVGKLAERYAAQGRMVVAEDYNFIRTVLMTAPTVEAVEVVHGRWVNPYMNRYGHPCHCCSICGFKASYQDKNYCPNCGAKMDGDGNG